MLMHIIQKHNKLLLRAYRFDFFCHQIALRKRVLFRFIVIIKFMVITRNSLPGKTRTVNRSKE